MKKETLLYLAFIFILPLSLVAQNKKSVEIDTITKTDSLTEVLVRSRRASYVLNNPMPITRITQKQIDETISSNIVDVLVSNTPGLNAVKTGPNVSKPFIRGLGYNRVLTMYDGIRQEGQQWGDEHGIEIDGYHIANAEVIKGPASMLYGSDALAGVISMQPVNAINQTSKWKGNIISEYQSNNNMFGNGAYIGYKDNQFFASANGSLKIAKNYQNSIDGRVYNTNFREANAAFTMGYLLKKGFVSLNGTLYHNLQGIPDGSRDSASRKFTKQIAEGEEDDMATRPIVSPSELNSYQLSPLHQVIKHYRLYSKFFKEIGGGDINATIAFQQNNRTEYSHPTVPILPGMNVRLQTINYDFKWDKFQLLPNVRFSLGANGMYQTNKNQTATDFPIPDYKLADGGIFAFAKWTKNRWTVSGGVRWDLRHIEWNDFYIVEDGLTGFERQATIAEQKDATLQFTKFSKNYTGVSSSLGATFKIDEHWDIKGNIARGYRVPNMTELASNGLDPGAHIVYLGNREFKPEFSLQQDLGLSARFRDWDFDLSFFNNNISNYIYLSLKTDDAGLPIVDPQGNKTYQYQQSKAQLYGMEAFVSVHPDAIKALSWSSAVSMVYGFNRKETFKNKGVEGEYLPLIPPAKISSTLRWQITVSKNSFLRSITPQYDVEWNAAQNRYLGLNETENRTSGYMLHNLGIFTDWKVANGKTFSLVVMAQNLFDKAFQSNMSRLKYLEYYSSSTNGHTGIYNMGRNITVKLIYPF